MPHNPGRLLTALALAAACASAHALDAEQTAQAAAAADGASTAIALSTGAVEANGLMPSSPVGILAVTAVKMALPRLARDMEPETRHTVLVATTGLYGGAAVSNLLIAAGAATPVGLVAGVLSGWFLAHREHDKLVAEAAAVVRVAEVQP